MAAFDYMIQQPPAMGSVLQGLETGFALSDRQRQMQLQEQEMRAKQEAQMRAQQIQERFYNNQNPSLQDVIQFTTTLDPALVGHTKEMLSALPQEQKKRNLSSGVQILSAIDSKNFDVAERIAEDAAMAMENSGDTNGAALIRQLAQVAKTAPDLARKGIMTGLTQYEGGQDALKSYFEAAAGPATVAKAEAEAKGKTAEAKIKEVQLKFAPEQFAADLGLTRAQIGQAKASAASSYASADASRASADRARAEANQIGAGIIPADKRPEAETKFRKEYLDQTSQYRETKNAYSRVLAAQPGAVGDIAMIFGYMKMLDPGSVVREGEYATAENARGVSDSVRNIYNRVISGQRLSEGQRKAFAAQAKKTYEAAAKEEKQVRSGVERIAKGYGLNTDNIFYSATETAPENQADQPIPDAPPPGAVRVKR